MRNRERDPRRHLEKLLEDLKKYRDKVEGFRESLESSRSLSARLLSCLLFKVRCAMSQLEDEVRGLLEISKGNVWGVVFALDFIGEYVGMVKGIGDALHLEGLKILSRGAIKNIAGDLENLLMSLHFLMDDIAATSIEYSALLLTKQDA